MKTIDEIARLRAVVADMAAGCPICHGTGENRDAMQVWDIPGAPVPECHYCAAALAAAEAGKETTWRLTG